MLSADLLINNIERCKFNLTACDVMLVLVQVEVSLFHIAMMVVKSRHREAHPELAGEH